MMLSAAMSLSACSTVRDWTVHDWGVLRDDSPDYLEYLTRAMTAEGGTRESMWRAAQNAGRSQSAALRRALMQSVPGHSGYDPMTAETSLQSLLNDQPAADITAVAKLRLAELKTEGRATAECRQEVGQLKARLSQVVDIERKLNSNGR